MVEWLCSLTLSPLKPVFMCWMPSKDETPSKHYLHLFKNNQKIFFRALRKFSQWFKIQLRLHVSSIFSINKTEFIPGIYKGVCVGGGEGVEKVHVLGRVKFVLKILCSDLQPSSTFVVFFLSIFERCNILLIHFKFDYQSAKITV